VLPPTLSDVPPVMTVGGSVGRCELSVEEATFGTEIIDELNGEVNVCDDYVPQIVSWPIPEGRTVGGSLSPSPMTKDGRTIHGQIIVKRWAWSKSLVGPSKDSEDDGVR
jgi:hypothetical protein